MKNFHLVIKFVEFEDFLIFQKINFSTKTPTYFSNSLYALDTLAAKKKKNQKNVKIEFHV